MGRVTLYSGHYGSGKSALAVDAALRLAESGVAVALYDLDIVNPYFRSSDSRVELEAQGVRVVASAYANTNVDTPAMPAEGYAIVHNRAVHAVVDVGGDDRGAMALGRYSEAIRDEAGYDLFFVLNAYRPLTQTAADAYAILREIEAACRLPFTAIINCSNLGVKTNVEAIVQSMPIADELSKLSGLRIAATAVRDDLCGAAAGAIPNILPVTIRQKWRL